MALVPTPPSARPPANPTTDLEAALSEFHNILTEDQRTKLQKIKAVPDADAVFIFTAQLDQSSRSRGRSIASRLHSVLQCVREFSAVVDVFVSSNPQIAALVWGSVKLTVQVRIPASSSLQRDLLTRRDCHQLRLVLRSPFRPLPTSRRILPTICRVPDLVPVFEPPPGSSLQVPLLYHPMLQACGRSNPAAMYVT
jgi:hypothetical protein